MDGGVQAGCPATDPRGPSRDDGTCDAGAFVLWGHSRGDLRGGAAPTSG